MNLQLIIILIMICSCAILTVNSYYTGRPVYTKEERERKRDGWYKRNLTGLEIKSKGGIVNVRKGDTLVLPCTHVRHWPYFVFWQFKYDKDLKNRSRDVKYYYEKTKSTTDWDVKDFHRLKAMLVVRNIRQENSGLYTCMFEDCTVWYHQSYRPKCDLKINYHVNVLSENYKFITKKFDITKTEGENVNFKCESDDPGRQFTMWKKEREQILYSNRMRVIREERMYQYPRTNMLRIIQLEQSDTGVYTCQVLSMTPPLEYVYNIKVLPKPVETTTIAIDVRSGVNGLNVIADSILIIWIFIMCNFIKDI